MRAMLAAVVIAMGACGVDGTPAVDGSEVSSCDLRPEPSFCAPLGSACDSQATRFCDRGLAWCTTSNVCRPFCSVTDYPRCPAGEAPSIEQLAGGGVACVCVPAT